MDNPENILNRITFYDIDSRPIEERLSERENLLYLREIKRDIAYYRKGCRALIDPAFFKLHSLQ